MNGNQIHPTLERWGFSSLVPVPSVLIRILDKDFSERTPEMAFAYYILYMCAHAFHMRQRKILSDNELDGWLRWMRSSFEHGEIREYWKTKIDPNRWFDPAFQKKFIDRRLSRMPPRSNISRIVSDNSDKNDQVSWNLFRRHRTKTCDQAMLSHENPAMLLFDGTGEGIYFCIEYSISIIRYGNVGVR
jgi:hypothetical protein